MIGLDVKETVRFSASGDTAEKKTVFVLGCLTQRDRIAIFGKAVRKDGSVDLEAVQEKALEIFNKGVRKIENLSESVPVLEAPFQESDIDAMPLEVVLEVVAEIMRIGFSSGAERKN